MGKMKKREKWIITVEGNINLFDMVKGRTRALEISGTGGKAKVIGIRDQKVEKAERVRECHI